MRSITLSSLVDEPSYRGHSHALNDVLLVLRWNFLDCPRVAVGVRKVQGRVKGLASSGDARHRRAVDEVLRTVVGDAALGQFLGDRESRAPSEASPWPIPARHR